MGRTWASAIGTHQAPARRGPVAVRAPGSPQTFGVRVSSLVRSSQTRRRPCPHPDSAPQPRRLRHCGAEHGKHALIEKPMATARRTATGSSRPRGEQRSRGVVSQHRFRKSPLARRSHRRRRHRRRAHDPRHRPDGRLRAPDDKWKFDPDCRRCTPIGQRMLADHHALVRGIGGQPSPMRRPVVHHPTHRPTRVSRLYQFENGILADIWLTYEIPRRPRSALQS